MKKFIYIQIISLILYSSVVGSEIIEYQKAIVDGISYNENGKFVIALRSLENKTIYFGFSPDKLNGTHVGFTNSNQIRKEIKYSGVNFINFLFKNYESKEPINVSLCFQQVKSKSEIQLELNYFQLNK